MSVVVSYKKQFLLGIMLVLVFILFLEILAFASLYVYDYCMIGKRGFYTHLDNYESNRICMDNSEINFGYNPNLYMLSNQHNGTININQEGFRGIEILKEKPDNTFRIFVIGGSTTFGLYTTSDNSTIPGFLQEMFNEQNLPVKIEIVNAGIASAFSYTETMYIQEKLIEFQPDMFIIYDGYNDLNREYADYNSVVQTDRSIILDGVLFIQDYIPIINLQYIASSILNDIKYALDSNQVLPFNSDNIDKKTEIWKERWNNICKIGEQENFTTLVTLQPIIGTGDRELSVLEERFFKVNNGERKVIAYEKYIKKLQELDDNCMIGDLTDALDISSGKPVYLDRVHLDDYGNSLVAEKLFEISLPIVKQNYLK